jgi:DNA-binding LytR/AlgR family response regulator
MKLNLLVAEDISKEMELIKGLLEKHFKTEINWTDSVFVSSFAATKKVLENGMVFDISILDRNLGDDANSFSLIKRFSSQLGLVVLNSGIIKNKKSIIEFSSTFSNAERITKPYVDEQFAAEMKIIFAKCIEQIKYGNCIRAFDDVGQLFINKDDLIYIQSKGDKIFYHFKFENEIRIAWQSGEPLKSHLVMLDKKRFSQINQSVIINKSMSTPVPGKRNTISIVGKDKYQEFKITPLWKRLF